MPATEQTIRTVVEEVLSQLGKRPNGAVRGAPEDPERLVDVMIDACRTNSLDVFEAMGIEMFVV